MSNRSMHYSKYANESEQGCAEYKATFGKMVTEWTYLANLVTCRTCVGKMADDHTAEQLAGELVGCGVSAVIPDALMSKLQSEARIAGFGFPASPPLDVASASPPCPSSPGPDDDVVDLVLSLMDNTLSFIDRVECCAKVLENHGEADFARRMREAKYDGDRVRQVVVEIEAETARRRSTDS